MITNSNRCLQMLQKLMNQSKQVLRIKTLYWNNVLKRHQKNRLIQLSLKVQKRPLNTSSKHFRINLLSIPKRRRIRSKIKRATKKWYTLQKKCATISHIMKMSSQLYKLCPTNASLLEMAEKTLTSSQQSNKNSGIAS